MQSLMNLIAFRGRRGVHVVSICAGVLFTTACSDVTLEPGTGGSAATGSVSTSTAKGTTNTTSTSTGGAMTPCEQYCNTAPSCGAPAADCVQICEQGTADPCGSFWDSYTACMGQHFDAATCKYQFHECEAEATAVGKCLDSTVCYTACDDTPGGCDCSQACVGEDWTWDCKMNGGEYDCDCTHGGVPTGSCTGQTAGSCENGALVAFCCLGM